MKDRDNGGEMKSTMKQATTAAGSFNDASK